MAKNYCKYQDMMFRCMCQANGVNPEDCRFYEKHSREDKCKFYREAYSDNNNRHCDNTRAQNQDYLSEETEVNNDTT